MAHSYTKHFEAYFAYFNLGVGKANLPSVYIVSYVNNIYYISGHIEYAQ